MILRCWIVAACVALSTNLSHAQTTLSEYTENVLTHVILHEVGHALIREFDLPILANEEVMADTFATVYIVQNMPERSLAIITSRAQSYAAEMDEETVFAEHPDDVWRAGQMICLAYGLDPDQFEQLARDSGMTGDEAANCRDSGPEIGRAWRRMIAPLKMPPNAAVTEVQGQIGEGPWKDAIVNSNLIDTLQPLMAGFDWHSLMTLHFDNCDTGATWFRNGRKILICDDLITRFEAQSR